MTTNKRSCKYPISNVVSYTGLSVQYKDFLCNFSAITITEPSTYSEAVKVLQCIDVMQVEISALADNKTWEVVPLPQGQKAIGCRWVYKVKYMADGHIERDKARLVAKNYSQREGLNYQETFSP